MSLRARLLLATAIATLAALVVVDVATVVLLSRSQLRQIDDSLAQSHVPVEQLVDDGTSDALATVPEIAPATYVAVVESDGRVSYTAPVGRRGEHAVSIDDATLSQQVGNRDRGPEGRSATVTAGDGDRVRLRIGQLRDGRTLIVGQSLHEADEVRGALIRILALATLAAMGAATALGAWLINRGLRPLRRVEASARQINDGDLADARVPGEDDTTEVGQLATSLNSMLDRLRVARDERERTVGELRASEARMRRFVADASHELRTPVAATAAYAELFDRGARDRPEDLGRAMAGIRTETGRMASLVDDLLALARLDERPPPAAGSIDLTELVFAAVDAARAVDPGRPIRTAVPDVVMVTGDPDPLRQVIDNLLANVRSHTPGGTPCEVTLVMEGDEAVLVVEDEGRGVTDEQLDRLFDRFYRVDSARSRSSGGAGLGLSIVQAIVEAHGGSIEAGQRRPTGLRIVVRLPAAAVAMPAPTSIPSTGLSTAATSTSTSDEGNL